MTPPKPPPPPLLTTVTDPSGTIHLCQWFSLNDRSARERRQVAADLGTVILRELCKPVG